MKLVCISDTHGLHDKVVLPGGDVLVHAGDLCSYGTLKEANEALEWLNDQPHKYIVFTAGNHDWPFERKEQYKLGRANYLENHAIEIDGKVFYGSPVTPEFCGWAFNVPRGGELRLYWNMIPLGVDVLITHGPPFGVLDQSTRRGPHLGCEDLAQRLRVVPPKVHIFGHIHGGYGIQTLDGTDFVNASICTESYRPTNPPIVVEL